MCVLLVQLASVAFELEHKAYKTELNRIITDISCSCNDQISSLKLRVQDAALHPDRYQYYPT